MSDHQREQLSALVDGEIEESLLRPTVSALESNPELTSAWERYHMIGQAIRGDALRPEFGKVAAHVRARIAAEPVPIGSRAARRPGLSRIGPFVGAALAASAAFLAVFAVPQLFDPRPSAPTPAAVVALTDPSPQFRLANPGQRWHLDKPALQSKLDRFLVNHQAYSPSSGIKGFLPYATVVGYEVDR